MWQGAITEMNADVRVCTHATRVHECEAQSASVLMPDPGMHHTMGWLALDSLHGRAEAEAAARRTVYVLSPCA